jgi:N-acyl-D-glutamate deacylase
MSVPMPMPFRRTARLIAALAITGCVAAHGAEGPFDLVIRGGRIIDPQSGLDGVRNVGIRGSRIARRSCACSTA